jgi:hypothetical protein
MKSLALILLSASLALALAQAGPSQLRTLGINSERANIPLSEVMSGGPPPQGIPAIGFGGDFAGAAPPTPAPRFVSSEEASTWLADPEPVIAFTLEGEARAYPLQILTWHEIVNDTVAGVPVAVTFCPLCNSALAFDRRLPLSEESKARVQATNSQAASESASDDFLRRYEAQWGSTAGIVETLEVTFGVSGMLYLSNMLMFDSHTGTLWAQLAGEGNVGTLMGTRLLRYPAQIVSFAEFREVFPDAPVLSRETGFTRRYGENPYVGYDIAASPPFLFRGERDGRLPPKARVVTIDVLGEDVAYPFEVLSERRVANDTVGGTAVAVFWQEGTASALDQASIARSRDVGAVGVFLRELGGRTLTFGWDGEAFVDEETGSRWNLLGRAVAGELAGQQLTPVVHDNTLWFAWAAFKPDTRIYRAED